MSHNTDSKRMMSINSMLDGLSNGTTAAHDNPGSRRMHDENRPNSVQDTSLKRPLSPRLSEAPPHNIDYRPNPHQPLAGAHAHDPARFFAPPQVHESMYGLHSSQGYQQRQQHNRLQNPNTGHLPPFPNNGHFQMGSNNNNSYPHHNNQVPLSLPTYSSPLPHERDRDREKREREKQELEQEDERRRGKERETNGERHGRDRERDYPKERIERDRERDRQEANNTPTGRFDSSRASPYAHSQPVPHHHHHVHHTHVAFKKPKLSIVSSKVFEAAKQHQETKLGQWTYNPTINLPFKLCVNATFIVYISRRFLYPENNHALTKRKVWGTEIYTDDSDMAAMLVHSTPEVPTGDVEMVVRVMPNLQEYKSSMSKSLRSRGWKKHDGLALYCEQVTPANRIKERHGKGFAKRSIDEFLNLSRRAAESPVLEYQWLPQKYQKRDHRNPEDSTELADPTDADEQEASRLDTLDDNEGDETIELSMEEQGTDAETSMVEPPTGPLITNMPDVLPTALAHVFASPIRNNDERKVSIPEHSGQEETVAHRPELFTKLEDDHVDTTSMDKEGASNIPDPPVDESLAPELDDPSEVIVGGPPALSAGQIPGLSLSVVNHPELTISERPHDTPIMGQQELAGLASAVHGYDTAKEMSAMEQESVPIADAMMHTQSIEPSEHAPHLALPESEASADHILIDNDARIRQEQRDSQADSGGRASLNSAEPMDS